MADENKLTDAEAQAMLDQLTAHFKEPVMPITRYCDGLRAWSKVVSERASHMKAKLFPGIFGDYKDPLREVAWTAYNAEMAKKLPPHLDRTDREYEIETLRDLEGVADEVNHVGLMISKSSLLDRLLYAGEQLRTERCPIHNGTWSGLEFGDNNCPHKCQLTGWVLHPVDEAKWRAKHAVNFPELCNTCSKPYGFELSVCSDFFHCCRDCFWWHGEVAYPCKPHLDEWVKRKSEDRVLRQASQMIAAGVNIPGVELPEMPVPRVPE